MHVPGQGLVVKFNHRFVHRDQWVCMSRLLAEDWLTRTHAIIFSWTKRPKSYLPLWVFKESIKQNIYSMSFQATNKFLHILHLYIKLWCVGLCLLLTLVNMKPIALTRKWESPCPEHKLQGTPHILQFSSFSRDGSYRVSWPETLVMAIFSTWKEFLFTDYFMVWRECRGNRE